jgi:hypothetical protein
VINVTDPAGRLIGHVRSVLNGFRAICLDGRAIGPTCFAARGAETAVRWHAAIEEVAAARPTFSR